MTGQVKRRPFREADRSFVFGLYAGTREKEMAMVPWTAEQKHAFVLMQFQAQLAGYREAYPEATHEILEHEGVPVGRIYLSRRADCLHLMDITIAPPVRNRGLGTRVLTEILSEARCSDLPATIYVESFNPSLRLFQRLGFRVAKQDGFELLLEWCASAVAESNPEEPNP
jgi:N-acetylglutamate synthase-like GNAT family acetyltransferase